VPVYADPTDGLAVPVQLLRTWTAGLLGTVGTPPDIAADVAEILVASDRRGIASHGTARLPNYVALVEAGVLDPAARPVRDAGRTALVRFDGRNGWGHHASRVAVDWAIEAVARTGAATAVVRNSNHYGIAGWYALRAAERGLIGISLSNTSPLVAPTRARKAMLGTNPIAQPTGNASPRRAATSIRPRGIVDVAMSREKAPKWPAGAAIAIGFVPIRGSRARVGATSGDVFESEIPIMPW
jgi:L-2-hydroxycarboxylate dehydrogenase (NAD+)